MNELTSFLVESILNEEITDKVVVYSGRFQPFHKGHYEIYKHLTKKFGKKNVYIGTTDKVSKPKSPLNFKEKREVMTTMFRVPKDHIVKIKNPYAPTEIVKKFDKETTALISVVGAKDSNRLRGKYFIPYEGDLDYGYRQKGYIYQAPNLSPVSGTQVRNGLSQGSIEERKKFFQTVAYDKFNQKIFDMLTEKLSEKVVIPKEVIESWIENRLSLLLSLNEATFNIGFATAGDLKKKRMSSFIDDEDVYHTVHKGRAEKIGYQFMKHIMDKESGDFVEYDVDLESNDPSESFIEDVVGRLTGTSQDDFETKKEYHEWFQTVVNSMALAGYDILDYKDEYMRTVDGDMEYSTKGLNQTPEPRANTPKPYKDEVDDTLDESITESDVNEWIDKRFPDFINEISVSGVFSDNKDPDDGPLAFYAGYDDFDFSSRNRAEKIGYKVIGQIMSKEDDPDTDYPRYPDGPIDAVSSFPAGVIGKLTAMNQRDFETVEAYHDWFNHMTRMAGMAGYDLIKFKAQGTVYDDEGDEVNMDNKEDLEKDPTADEPSSRGGETPDEPENVTEMVGNLFTKEEIDKMSDDFINEFIGQIGYPSKEQYEKKKKDLAKLQDKLDDFKDEDDKEYKKVKENFDKVKFYVKYYENLTPDSMMVTEDNGDIRIKFDNELNERTDVQTISKSLGIPRTKMPQINSKDVKDFIKYLSNKGVNVRSTKIPVSRVHMTQKEINKDKVRKLVSVEKSNLDKPVIVSKDNYILDGHHRVVALLNIDKNHKLKAIMVDLPINELLDMAYEYPRVTYKSVNELIENLDRGTDPYAVDINKITLDNDTFRTTKWSGKNLQMTLMSIKPGESIGLEKHDTIDQFVRIEQGKGVSKMGKEKDNLTFKKDVEDDFAVFIPAGYYHNIVNTGDEPLKLYSIYAPPNHPKGRVDVKKPTKNELKESKLLGESKLKLNIPRDIQNIHKLFKKNGKKLYIVGGAVRDSILGKRPKDFDLATDAKPDEVLDIAKKGGLKTVEVGKSFGVVVVGGHEIATFRKDIGQGRRPDSVEYTDIEGDVRRRDLTINALFYDIDRGEIVDLVGGIEDLKKKQVRTVGDPSQRFEEDPLRKLRAVRFAGQLGGGMDGDTYEALNSNPSLKGVSPERIRDEFIKGIKRSKSSAEYLRIADDVGMLSQIFPKVKVTKPFIIEEDYQLLIAYLFQHLNPKGLGKYLHKLTYTTDEIRNITFLVKLSNFDVDDVVHLKREQKHISLIPSEILRFGKHIGKDFRKFLDFKLSVSGKEVMDQGFKGKDIGDEIERREIQNYLNESKLSLNKGFTFKPQKTFQGLKRGVEYVLSDITGKIGNLTLYVNPKNNKSKKIPVKVRSVPEFYSNVIGKNVPNFYSESLNEDRNKLSYGCLMLKTPMKSWETITSQISEEDVYQTEDGEFGIENNPHITVLYGLHENVTQDEIKELSEDVSKVNYKITGISSFKNEDYDVLKFTIESDNLTELNETMKSLPHTSTYPEYHPHMTIGYLKPGMAEKYEREFEKPIELNSNKFIYSTSVGSKSIWETH